MIIKFNFIFYKRFTKINCLIPLFIYWRHEDLLNSDGIYAEMWNQQSKQQTKTENSDVEENQKMNDSKPVKGKGVGKNGNSNITWSIISS